MTPEGKAAFLKAIHDGKAFIGTHAASDTFHTQPDDPQERSNRYINHGEKADPYVRMLGAEFIKHGPQQVAHMRCVDQKFPGMKAAGEGFDLNEEWYSLKDFQPDLHVLLVQETKGMKGPEYQRAPYPATWARKYGKGRVFFTSMGHREDVWTNPLFVSILTGGIGWALGKSKADIAPNIETACPGYREIPPKS
jgi:type 1 glutamine amidotransferase